MSWGAKKIADMPQIIHYLPELEESEGTLIARLTAAMSHDDIQRFAASYRSARKDPQTLRLLAIVGIVAIPGLHRFWMGQAGIGFLYLFTGGLLWIGTIRDIVKYRELAFVYNRQVAERIASNVVSSKTRSNERGMALAES